MPGIARENVRRYGFVGALLQLWNDRRITKAGSARSLELIEILSLGGKRQLMLIRCAEDWFLVGGSADCINTIVKIDTAREEFVRQDGLSV